MMKDDSSRLKSWYEGLERMILPRWLFEPENARYRRRAAIGFYSALFAIVLLLIYAALTFIQHRTVLAFTDLGTAVALACVIMYFRMTKGPHNYAIQAGIAIFGCFCIYLCFSGDAVSPTYLWAYTFPLTAMFLLGSRRGTIAAMLFLFTVIILLIFYVPYVVHFPLSLKLRLASSLLTVSVLSYLFEQSREKANQRMKLALNELGQSKEEIEQHVGSRTMQLFQVNLKLLQEIQERNRMEVALRESEERYRVMFTNMNSGVAVYKAVDDGKDFIFKDFNAAAERIEKVQKEDLLERCVTEVFPGVRDFGLFEVFQRVWKTGNPENYPVSLYKDGRISGWRENSVYKLPSGEIVAIYDDTTERMKAEEELRESEEKYRTLASTVDSMYLVDRECRYRFMNEMHLSRLGLTLDAIVGRSYGEFHSRDNMRQFADTVEAVFETGKSFQTEHRSERDGRDFLRTFSPVRYREGKAIIAVTVVSKDITDRKRAEKELQVSERKYRRLHNSMMDAFVSVDMTGRIQEFNQAYQAMLGYSEEELYRLTYMELTPEKWHALEAKIVEEQIMPRGYSYSYEKEYRRKDGTVFPVELRTFLLADDAGQPAAMWAIVRDITERKRAEDALRDSEEKYRSLASTADLTFLVGRDCRYLFMNERYAERFNVPINEFIGRPYGDFHSEEVTRIFSQLVETVIRTGESLQHEYKSDIDERIFLQTFSPVKDREGRAITAVTVFSKDITERKQMDKSLRVSEKKYRTIFENAIEGIFRTTPEGRYIHLNPAYARMFGFGSPEEMIEQIADIEKQIYVNPRDRERFKKLLAETGSVEGFEAECYRKDGSKMWIAMNARAIRDQDDNILHIEGTNIDITPRKRAEEALRESEMKYRQLAETAHDIIVTVDLDYKITYANKATLNFSDGIDPVGMSLLDFTPPHLHELQLEIMHKRREGFSDMSVYEWEIINPTGKIVTFDARATLLAEDGKPSGVMFFARDITERKRAADALRKSEEQYRSLVESTRDSVYLLDRDLRYVFANSAYLSRLGLQLQELIGRSYGELHTLTNDTFPEYVKYVFDTGKATEFKYRSSRDNKYFLRTLAPVRGEHGETVAVNIVSKDVSILKETEDTLRNYHGRLRSLMGKIQGAREEERAMIAREIHDELGSALTGLKIDLSNLARYLPRMRDAAKKDVFMNKIHSMTTLIDETIHTVRRIITEIRPSILDDFGIVAAVEWQAQEFQKRMGIRCIFTSSLQDMSLLDEERSIAVFRVFQESLTNVVRHAGATEVTVRLYIEADILVLKIEDNGKGITEKEMSDITSLGLLGMRERAAFFGGTFEISGKPGKGTIVTVRFPLE